MGVPSTRVCHINSITEKLEESSMSLEALSELLSTRNTTEELSQKEFTLELNTLENLDQDSLSSRELSKTTPKRSRLRSKERRLLPRESQFNHLTLTLLPETTLLT